MTSCFWEIENAITAEEVRRAQFYILKMCSSHLSINPSVCAKSSLRISIGCICSAKGFIEYRPCFCQSTFYSENDLSLNCNSQMWFPVLGWQSFTATAVFHRLESPDRSSNVHEDEDWSCNYSERQECCYGQENSAGDFPRYFVFKNPSSRFEYRDGSCAVPRPPCVRTSPTRESNSGGISNAAATRAVTVAVSLT